MRVVSLLKWVLILSIPGGLCGAALWWGYKRLQRKSGFYILPAFLLFLVPAARAQSHQKIQETLTRSYAEFNTDWFGNKLPSSVSILYVLVPDSKLIAQTRDRINADGSTHFTIFINAYYDRDLREAEFTELHEMCHVYNSVEGREFEAHGTHWQACMLQLAMNGAFNNLW